jgi:hypothetical protein
VGSPPRRGHSLVHLGGQLDVAAGRLEGLAEGLQPAEVLLLGGDELQKDVGDVLWHVADYGRLFDEGTLGRVGLALERAFGVAGERPPEF